MSELTYEPYNKNSFLVKGDQAKYGGILKQVGARWFKKVEGWFVPLTRGSELKELVDSINSGQPAKTEGEKPGLETADGEKPAAQTLLSTLLPVESPATKERRLTEILNRVRNNAEKKYHRAVSASASPDEPPAPAAPVSSNLTRTEIRNLPSLSPEKITPSEARGEAKIDARGETKIGETKSAPAPPQPRRVRQPRQPRRPPQTRQEQELLDKQRAANKKKFQREKKEYERARKQEESSSSESDRSSDDSSSSEDDRRGRRRRSDVSSTDEHDHDRRKRSGQAEKPPVRKRSGRASPRDFGRHPDKFKKLYDPSSSEEYSETDEDRTSSSDDFPVPESPVRKDEKKDDKRKKDKKKDDKHKKREHKKDKKKDDKKREHKKDQKKDDKKREHKKRADKKVRKHN